MSRMKSLVAMLLAFAMLLGVAAVPALAEETRDDIVIALWSEPSTLCGGLAASTSVNMVSRQIFDTLIAKGDEAGTYEPTTASP